MIIHGLNKLTLLDYPQHMACTVFTGHCNLRCPFCQNASLVLFPESQPVLPESDFFDYLRRRQGILEGVCVTGGEPTLSADLLAFLSKIKSLGYLVKLDTNGTRPSVLKAAVTDGLVDYVAMDIKSSQAGYATASGVNFSDRSSSTCSGCTLDDIKESVDFLMQGNVPYEFRTTVVRELHDKETFLQIFDWLNGADAYYLQSFEDSGELVAGFSDEPFPMSGYTLPELQEILSLAAPYFKTVGLRGID